MKKFFTIFISIILSVFFIPITTFASERLSSQTNLNEVNQVIDMVLSSKYDSLEKLKVSNIKNYIKNDELEKLFNKRNSFYIELSKKFNTRINNYNSNVIIENLTKNSDNKYIVNVSYNVTFNLENSDIISKSFDEKYKLELINENNKWYITKLINLDDIAPTNPKINIKNSRSLYSETKDNTLNFDNYQNLLNSQLSSIDNMNKNIDKYYNFSKKSSSENFTSFARNYSGYNRQGAVDYAHKYAYNNNPKYKYFDGADCTNFVSQCVHEGGGIPEGFGWKPALKDAWVDTKAWNCVNEFFDYMVSKGYATAPPDGCKHSEIGDVIQFYNKDKQEFSHTVILTKINDEGICYSAHSKPRYDYPVWLAFDGTYTNLRLIKFW